MAVVFLATGCLSAHAAEIFEAEKGSTEFGGSVRTYQLSPQKDLANQSYQVDITFTVASGVHGKGSAFFGVGNGEPNPDFFDTPTTHPSAILCISPADHAGGPIIVMVNGEETEKLAGLGDGTHRIRLTWDAGKKQARFQLQANWEDGMDFVSQKEFFGTIEGTPVGPDVHFVCGGAAGAKFSDAVITPLDHTDL